MSLADKAAERYGDPENYDDVDVSDAYDDYLDLPLKPGEYLVKVMPDYTEHRDTGKGGEQLNVDLKVLAPKYEERRIFYAYDIDCPKNQDWEDKEVKKALYLCQCAGANEPTPEALAGNEVIVRTGLEWNDYKDGEYQPTIREVKPTSEGPPMGPFDDDNQPDIWDEAVEHAKGGEGSANGSGEGSGKGSGKTKSFDSDDVPF